jgi:DNA transposition AAA+ family ATPase
MVLRKIEKFLDHSGMAWTKFGRLVAHDPRLVGDMRNGRKPREALIERVDAFIKAYGEMNRAV